MEKYGSKSTEKNLLLMTGSFALSIILFLSFSTFIDLVGYMVGNEELTIAGLLKYDPFTTSGTTEGKITLISSADTFTRLTGIPYNRYLYSFPCVRVWIYHHNNIGFCLKYCEQHFHERIRKNKAVRCYAGSRFVF